MGMLHLKDVHLIGIYILEYCYDAQTHEHKKKK